jgi:uncharacterized protein
LVTGDSSDIGRELAKQFASHGFDLVIAAEDAAVDDAAHELAHALGVGYEEYGRRRAEVIVDTTTFIVCSSVGLDVAGESVPYVAGWGETGALDAVTEFAQQIDMLARRLEDALGDDGVPLAA